MTADMLMVSSKHGRINVGAFKPREVEVPRMGAQNCLASACSKGLKRVLSCHHWQL